MKKLVCLWLGLLLLWAGPSGAVTRYVPSGYDTIQDALRDAVSGDAIQVEPGTYTEVVDLPSGVTLQGEETAATILTGGITVTGGSTVQRVTVSGKGILVSSGASGVSIFNAILRNVDGTALAAANTSSLSVENNTFYGNKVGCTLSGATGTVSANLFVANGTALSAGAATNLDVLQNDFYDNGSDGTLGTGYAKVDPLFVDPGTDFHFLETSPDQVRDWGAYGGSGADPTPQAVTLDPPSGTVDSGITLTWSANRGVGVSGYKVYYGPDADNLLGTGASEGSSPIRVGVTTTTETLTGLEGATAPEIAPAGILMWVGDGQLILSWDETAGANGYRVQWGTGSGVYDESADAGAATSYTIGGLTNGVQYFVTVEPYDRVTYAFAVTVTGGPTNESSESRKSNVETLALQEPGPTSEEVSGTPAAVAVGFPDLPERGGCFVAGLNQPSAGRMSRIPWVFGLGALAVLLAAGLRLRRTAVCAVVLVAALLLPEGARGEVFWGLRATGGAFFPLQKSWGDNYDQKVIFSGLLGAACQLGPRWEVGLEGGYRRATGKDQVLVPGTSGQEPLVTSHDLTLTVYPVQVYGLYLLQFSPEQLVVPYLGAGLTRHYYRLEVSGGGDTRGHLDGYLVRAGVRVGLDRFDPRSADRAREGFGLRHTFLTIQGEYSRVDDFGAESADLGGWSLSSGFVFNF